MPNQTTERLFRALPFKQACELHQRLVSGDNSPKTTKMLRHALHQAGFARHAA